jgi:uncharacterized membrane protein
VTSVSGGDVPAAAADAAELRTLRRMLLIAGAFLYFAYALITPPFQTPDEHQHLFRAWQLAHFQLHGERRGQESGGMLPVGLPAAAAAELGSVAPHIAVRPVPKRPLSAMFRRATHVSDAQPKRFVNFLGSVAYSPAGYVPQIAAIWVGSGLGLSVEWILRLGRLLNAALTLGLFTLALTVLPVGRIFVLLLALMPMTCAMAGSLGQDGLILGSCAILIAVGVRARLEGRWRRSSLLLMGLCAAAIALSKMVYIPLLAVALFPLPRRSERLRWIAVPAALGALALALSALWLHANSGSVVRMFPGATDPGAQLTAILHHPAGFAAVLGRTVLYDGMAVALSTFSFGWMTVGPVWPAVLLATAALGFGLYAGDAGAAQLGGAWRGWAVLLCLVISTGIATALYLAGDPLGARVVAGLQGRYFLPLLPLLCLAMLRRGTARPGRADLPRLAFAVMLAANGAALLTIGGAFYTF